LVKTEAILAIVGFAARREFLSQMVPAVPQGMPTSKWPHDCPL